MSRRPSPDRLAAIVTLRGIQREAAAAAAGDAASGTRAAASQLRDSERDLTDIGERFHGALGSGCFDPRMVAGWAAAWRAQAAEVEQDRECLAGARTEEEARRAAWNAALALEQAAACELRSARAHDLRRREERRLADLAECAIVKEERA